METPMIDERQGLPSASGADRLYHCAGSPAAEAQAPAETPSDECMQGNEIHEALERDDFDDLDEEGRNIAQRIKAMDEQAVQEYMTEPFEIWRETRLWIYDTMRKNKLASAKSDVFYVGKTQGIVLDYKTGYLPTTPASRNIQTRWQVLALWHAYPNLTRIRGVMAPFRFTGKMTVCDFDLGQLTRCQQELEFKLWLANQEHASRVPGAHCRYCRAKAFCTEAAAFAMLPVAMTPKLVDLTKLTAMEIEQAVARLAPQDLLRLHDSASLIEKVLEASKARLKALPDDVLRGMGRFLGEPTQKASVADPNEAWSILAANGLMKPEEFNALVKVPLGKVEEVALPRLAKISGKTQKDAKVDLRKLLHPCLEYTQTSQQLKRLKE